MDLHAWITAKVDETEHAAHAACPGPWSLSAEQDEVIASDGIRAFDAFSLSGEQLRATARHAARHDPLAVLRRCEADRRILERHDRSTTSEACQGCGYDECWPLTDNLNDCPELLDLAHAHGLTEGDLATLERPSTPPRVPVKPPTFFAITADQAPATFRP